VPAVSIERIRDWLAKKRTPEAYAFSAIDVALGTGAPPAEIGMLCNSAADSGMLASVYVGGSRFFTHPLVSMEEKIGAKRMRMLEEVGKVRRAGDHFEWANPKPKPAKES
jgi:hypothetical protein